MPDDTPAVSVVVVTWNCRDLALRCLATLAESRLGASHEVIVVDNASADGTADAIAAAHPDIRLVRSAANLGFAGGNNAAFKLARGRHLLLLNPDAFPADPDSLGRLVRFLDSSPAHAAVGSRLVFEDGRHQVGDAGWRPTPASVVVHAFGLGRLLRGARGLFVVAPPADPDAVVEVDWICGACLLVRAEAVRAAGGLDESLFMYGEDVEFGCRLRDHGMRLAYLPGVRVVHLQGGSQGGLDGVSARWLDSLGLVYARLNRGRHWTVFRLSLAAGFGLRAIAYGLVSLLPGRRAARSRAAAMARFGRHAWGMAMP